MSRRRKPLLTDRQWELIEPSPPPLPKSGKGGHPWAPIRPCLEGIQWILRTGARWQDLPDKYPGPSTCWRRLQLWEEQDVRLDVWCAFLATQDERKRLNWSEAFADGSFASAKKEGLALVRPSGGKARNGWWWSTAKVFLWESTWTRPRQRKSNLLEPTLATIAMPRAGPGRPRQKPERIIADKAYDSDPMRARLAKRHIELIAPHRRNGKKRATQAGRKLRRYLRPWKVERTFAWLGDFRRLLVRWERHLTMYLAFFHVACLLLALRRL